MENERFDALAKFAAGKVSRRSVARGLVAAVFGGILGRGSVDAAGCRAGGVSCRENANCCSGSCEAEGGRKTCACQSGYQRCGSGCLPISDFQDDPNNCGTCGNRCGGGACTQGVCLKPLGAPAESSAECASGFLSDGVCCENACTGNCESCANGGLCRAVTGAPVGGRPACSGANICEGYCDGKHSDCVFPSTDVSCGPTICISNNTAEQNLRCNGQGGCSPQNFNCSPYVCRDDGCLTSCESVSDCYSPVVSLVCFEGSCVSTS